MILLGFGRGGSILPLHPNDILDIGHGVDGVDEVLIAPRFVQYANNVVEAVDVELLRQEVILMGSCLETEGLADYLELFLFGWRCACTYDSLLVGVESQEIPVFDTAHHVDRVEVIACACI
jgi:hypothetical protein